MPPASGSASQNAPLTHALGTVHLFARDYDRAAELFRQALELDPLHAWSHDRLGQAYEAKGDVASARAEFERFNEYLRRAGLRELGPPSLSH